MNQAFRRKNSVRRWIVGAKMKVAKFRPHRGGNKKRRPRGRGRA